MNISDRKRTILTAVIKIHTSSGDPVGSSLLASFLDSLPVSSATLRNEMAELTTLGLLEQPYTSAGRIPTQLGIRYYVDNLMSQWSMSQNEQEHILNIISKLDSDPEKATESSARTLAEMFNLSSIAMTPRSRNPHIVHFDVLKIGKFNLALIGVTNAGSINSRVCRLTYEISNERIGDIENILNELLVFVSPEDIMPELLEKAEQRLSTVSDNLQPLLLAVTTLVDSLSDFRLYTDGEQNLLGYNEIRGQIHRYLEYINNPERMAAILTDSLAPVSIYIGEEIDPHLSNMALITAHFRTGNLNGHFGIAGPSRMNYAYIVPRLKFFCDKLSEAFSE